MSDATDDARALVKHLRATAIPLLAARITRDGMPVIVLNTAGCPEVRDLFRPQVHIGQGEATSVWHFANLHKHQLRCAWLIVATAIRSSMNIHKLRNGYSTLTVAVPRRLRLMTAWAQLVQTIYLDNVRLDLCSNSRGAPRPRRGRSTMV